jgi:predicted transcriptional regulator
MSTLGSRQRMEIEKARRLSGLRKVTSGTIVCLRCDKKFKSNDVRLNKICYNCKRGWAWENGDNDG